MMRRNRILLAEQQEDATGSSRRYGFPLVLASEGDTVRVVELGAGAACELTLTLDDTELSIVLQCHVSHLSGGRAGLEFTNVDVDAMQHLRRIVELNLPEDGPLGRFSD